jgi:hypothetical protein
MLRSAFQVLLLLLTLTTMLRGQEAALRIVGPQASQVRGVAARGPLRQAVEVDSTQRPIRPTHWKAGALVGGVTAGVGLALFLDGFCRSSDTGDCGGAPTAGFLLGGVLGGLAGALIGGQFPKSGP